MNTELALSARIIANESASFPGNYFDSSVDKIKLFFDDIGASVHKSVERLTNLSRQPLVGTENSEIQKSTKDLNYLAIAALELPAPAGLKGDMYHYAISINFAIDRIRSLEQQVLKPVMKELARLYSNPQDLNTENVRPLFRDWSKTLDNTATRVAEYLDDSTGNGKLPVRKLYSRLQDYHETGRQVDGINEQLRAVDMDDLLEYADRIAEMFNRIANLANNEETVTVSNAVALNLSDMAFMVARELEFAGAMYVKAQELGTVYNAQVAALNNYNRQL